MKKTPLVRKTPMPPSGPIKRKVGKAKAHKKKTSAASLLARADKLAGAYIRARGVCEAADYPGCQCGGLLAWAHLKSRMHKTIRHDPLNAVCLCYRCHRFFTREPDLWTKFIEERYPGRWQRLNDILQEKGRPDYEYWIGYYKRQATRGGLE